MLAIIVLMTVLGHLAIFLIARKTGCASILNSCYIGAVVAVAAVSAPTAFVLFLLAISGHGADGYPDANAVMVVHSASWLISVGCHILTMVSNRRRWRCMFGTVAVVGYCHSLWSYIVGAEGSEIAAGSGVWCSWASCSAFWIPLQLVSICIVWLIFDVRRKNWDLSRHQRTPVQDTGTS
jgi:hypothetical protein